MSRSARFAFSHNASCGNSRPAVQKCKKREPQQEPCCGIFNTQELILLNLDCPFFYNNPNSPSHLPLPQKTYSNSILDICPLKKYLYISSQFLTLSGQYILLYEIWALCLKREGRGVGRSLSQFETLFNQFIVISTEWKQL